MATNQAIEKAPALPCPAPAASPPDGEVASVDQKVNSVLANLSGLFLALLGLVLVGAIGLVDYWTGPELSLAIFYLIPIAVCAWWGGFSHGILLSLTSTLTWHWIDLLETPSTHPGIRLWNGVVRFGFFVITSSLLSRLRAAIRHEQALARTDPLTGAANGRTFYERAQLELQRCSRTLRPFTVAYLDLDNFKEVNDRQGHAAGDALLHDVAATLRSHTRATDLVARLGGDEFALLFPETEAAGAGILLPRLHATLLQEMAGKGWPTTCSMGAATFFQPPPDVDVMLRRVDALMYSAKRAGKGRIQHEAVHGPVETLQANPHHAERRAAVWLLCNRAVRVTLDGVSNDQQWLAKIRDISLKGIALDLPCGLQEGTLLTIEPLHDSHARTLLVRVLRTTAASESWLHECHLSNELSDQELQAWLT